MYKKVDLIDTLMLRSYMKYMSGAKTGFSYILFVSSIKQFTIVVPKSVTINLYFL